MSNVILPTIYQAATRPSPGDLQAFSEFLRHADERSEKDLQRLLERHPSIIGVLGYCQFISEHPLYKTGTRNETLLDKRRMDRADLIVAKPAPPAINLSNYKSAHILELKRANLRIAERDVGQRLSEIASAAAEQLKEYRRWLMTIPENRDMIRRLGWEIGLPSMTLVMGRHEEFRDNPGQLEEVRANLQDHGVTLLTVDDLFDAANQRVTQLELVMPATAFLSPIGLRVVAGLNRFTPETLFTFPHIQRERKHGPQGYPSSRSYVPWLRDEFDFRCALCLRRETFGPDGPSGFGVMKLDPSDESGYDNLVYACMRCLSLGGSYNIHRLPTASDLTIQTDGEFVANTDHGRLVSKLFMLNGHEQIEWRRSLMLAVRSATKYPEDEDLAKMAARLTKWPNDVPDLSTLRPPHNSRPGGLANDYFTQRRRG